MTCNISGSHGGKYKESRLLLVRTGISQERIASIIRMKIISELGTTLAVISTLVAS
jgi:hypothetical protein